MGACTWLQVALLSGCWRTDAIRAMHRAVARAYTGSPHTHQATTKILHHVSYTLPVKRCQVAQTVRKWLMKHAYWSHDLFSFWVLPPDLLVGGICGAWNTYLACLNAVIWECTTV